MEIDIYQYGAKYVIYIDKAFTTLEGLSVMCNLPIPKLRTVLNKRNRNRKVEELLLKAEAGVPPSSKTFWRGATPMWKELVVKETGLSLSSTKVRIKQWLKDGNRNRLMRPKNLQLWYSNMRGKV